MKQYIDKTAVVAEIENRREAISDVCQGYISDKKMAAEYILLNELLDFLDTIEVKEVDLNHRKKNKVMKAFTSIEQSKKLAEILPIESADMIYAPFGDTHPWVWNGEVKLLEKDSVPCLSLAALLSVLPSATLDTSDDHYCRVRCRGRCTEWHDNPIDACFEMIIRLHELDLL